VKVWRNQNIIELLEKMSDNYFCVKYVYKKSLKIPKRQSESVYRRRTDNIMVKRKKYKRTNNDLQNIHIKLKIAVMYQKHGNNGFNLKLW
jgi:hypothetical protein